MATKSKGSDNLEAHEETYNGFLKLLNYGTIASVVTAALVLFLITR